MKVKTFESAVFDMRDKSRLSVEEVSNEIGMPVNTLYQKTSPTSEIEPRASELVRMMRGFRRYDPLDVMARTCGFLLVKMPRGKAKEAPPLGEYQEGFAKLFRMLFEFHQNPDLKAIKPLIKEFDSHLQDTVNMRANIKADFNQAELELEES